MTRHVARLVQDEANFGDRAPATEALIDLRVNGAIDLDALQALSTEFAADFPIEEQLVQWVGKVEMKATEPVTKVEHRGVIGLLRRDAANQAVVQVRRDGFTFSKLKPYTSWNDVCARARVLWRRYVELARPTDINRLAVRYINHIVPPRGWTTSRDWLSIHATSARIPGVAPEPNDFYVRMLQPHPNAQYLANITVATVEASAERALLLDIDVVHEGTYPSDSEDAWVTLAELRDFKNDVFFGTITDRTKEFLLNVAVNG